MSGPRCACRLRRVCVGIVALVLSTPVFGQLSSELDVQYAYPFAAGIVYRSANPLAFLGTDFGAEYQTIDVSAYFRLPLRNQPAIQPQIQIGMLSVQSLDRTDPERWEQLNHREFYLMPGVVYTRRLSKTFEIGADASVGVGEAYFPLLVEGTTSSSPYFRSSIGARATIGLSYNFVLDINPFVSYQLALSPLSQFNGFSAGIGISGSYRGGVDPDAPQATIRAIQFGDVNMPAPLFAAMTNYYVDHPIGTVTLTNIENYTVTDVEVSFFQPGYMDLATVASTIPELAPGEEREVDLFARFNGNVFTTQGTLNQTGQLSVSYQARGREADQQIPVSYELYDKTALTWDNLDKVGAFITPQDSALQNYATAIRSYCNLNVNPGLSENLQTAMQIYTGMRHLGMLYEKDPSLPFDLAQEDPLVVDSISLPRDTLGAAGDCDDLTVLYCALLEAVGIGTGYITVPGHIYPVFDTGVPTSDYRMVHPESSMTLSIDGTLWVPVEVTMINSGNFLEAWRTGAGEWYAYDEQVALRDLTRTAVAQRTFRPVTLIETDIPLQYGDQAAISEDFRRVADSLADLIVQSYDDEADARGRKQAYNRLGIVAAQLERFDEATAAFNEALRLDRNYLAPKINLANVYYLTGYYEDALRILHDAEEDLTSETRPNQRALGSVYLSLAKVYDELENFDRSAEYFALLADTDPELAAENSYLRGVSASDSSRAGEVRSTGILFVGDEDLE